MTQDALDRFIEAQAGSYDTALREIRAGDKRGHWMWFVFPQLAGLGLSATARRYAIVSIEEARGYLAHPLLGARYRECVDALLAHGERSAAAVFGEVDAMKLRSSLTLFAAAVDEPRFDHALAQYFGGERDAATLALLAQAVPRSRE